MITRTTCRRLFVACALLGASWLLGTTPLLLRGQAQVANAAGRATVVVYRPKDGRVRLHPKVLVNDIPAVQMSEKEFLVLRLIPGKYVLSSDDQKSTLSFDLKDGDLYCAKVEFTSLKTALLGKLEGRLVQTSTQIGLREAKSLKPVEDRAITDDPEFAKFAEVIKSLPEDRP